MNWRAMRWSVTGLACAVMLVIPAALYPCGPVFSSPKFVLTRGPQDDAKYVAGDLGIPLRTYDSKYAYIAYRYWSGIPLTKEERASVLIEPASVSGWGFGEDSGLTRPWLEARSKVAGVTPVKDIATFKEIKDYQFFLNCPASAFTTAAHTLGERKKSYDAAQLKDWVGAQDMVFANCFGNGATLPAELPESAAVLARQDRAYQIAAANFYAENFDVAHDGFLKIAADTQSPWHVWGGYLAARALIRKSTLERAEGFDDAPMLQAEAELKKVIADPALAPVHDAARGILGFVDFRLHPAETEARLATALAKSGASANLPHDIKDYLLLQSSHHAADTSSDLSEWIAAFKASATVFPEDHEGSAEAVIAQWQRKQTLPWLTLAISSVRASDKGAQEVIAAAEKVKADSPAYPTVRYHLARLAAESGNPAATRKQVDAFLVQNNNGLSLSTKNMFRHLRLDYAADFSDALRYAQVQPVSIEAEGFNMEDRCQAGDKIPSWCKQYFVDPDAAHMIERAPVARWIEAAQSNSLNNSLLLELALSGWCRAVLIQDWNTADRAAKVVKQYFPAAAEYLDPFVKATDPKDKEFASIFVILHWPGIRPTLIVTDLRDDRLNEINNYRMNWWCDAVKPEEITVPANILSAKELETGGREQRLVLSKSVAPNYLVPIVLSWAKAHPDDPRVPEALALSVKATRFGCTDAHTTDFSKAAFTLLHGKYPQSEWAKKTKYYY